MSHDSGKKMSSTCKMFLRKKSGQVDRGGRFSTALDFFFLAPLGFISVPFLYYFLIISPSVFI